MVFDGIASALLFIGHSISFLITNLVGLILLLLLLTYTGLFFVLQYYLIKLYIRIYTTIKEKAPFVYNFIKETLTHEEGIKENINNSHQSD